MDPFLRYKNCADRELGAWMQIRLTDAMDDTWESVGSGCKLSDRKRLNWCFGCEEFNCAVWVGVYYLRRLAFGGNTKGWLVRVLCANLLNSQCCLPCTFDTFLAPT